MAGIGHSSGRDPPLLAFDMTSVMSHVSLGFNSQYFLLFWSRWRELNPRPRPYHGRALPLSHIGVYWDFWIMGTAYSAVSSLSIKFSRKIQAGVSRISPLCTSIQPFSRSGSRREAVISLFLRRKVRRSWIFFSSSISSGESISFPIISPR